MPFDDFDTQVTLEENGSLDSETVSASDYAEVFGWDDVETSVDEHNQNRTMIFGQWYNDPDRGSNNRMVWSQWG